MLIACLLSLKILEIMQDTISISILLVEPCIVVNITMELDSGIWIAGIIY